MKSETLHIRICPRCGASYVRTPALSRADGRTLICPDCGTREALESIGVGQRNRNRSLNPSTGRSGKIHNFFQKSLCTL